MKFGVIGLGSMGKRRLRCLRFWGERDVVAWDPKPERRADATAKYGATPCGSLDAFWAESPGAVLISTPPDPHTPLVLECVKRGIPFFTEASVIDDYDPLLAALKKKPRLLAALSCCYHFNPVVRAARDYLSRNGRTDGATFLYHCGQYLPDWHPYENYRRFYVARARTAAAREMLAFDMVWLTWLFGPVRSIASSIGRVTKLEIDGPDVILSQAEFASGARGAVLIDIVSRNRFRDMRIVHEDYTMLWSLLPPFVKVYEAKTGKWRDLRIPMPARAKGYTPYEWTYEEEMKAFIDAAKGRGKFPYTFKDDRRILALLPAAEKSNRTGRRVRMSHR